MASLNRDSAIMTQDTVNNSVMEKRRNTSVARPMSTVTSSPSKRNATFIEAKRSSAPSLKTNLGKFRAYSCIGGDTFKSKNRSIKPS